MDNDNRQRRRLDDAEPVDPNTSNAHDSQFDIPWGGQYNSALDQSEQASSDQSKQSSQYMSRRKNNKSTNRKMILIRVGVGLLCAIAVIAVFGYVALYRPGMKVMTSAKKVEASARELKSAFKQNNIDAIKAKMNQVSTDYTQLENDSKAFYWAGFIPYVADYKNGIEAGRYTLNAGSESIKAIEPHAELLGFKKGETSFSEKPAEDRLHTAVLTLDKIMGKIDVISKNIEEAEARIARIDERRYPEKIGNREIRSNIKQIKDQFYGVSTLFVDAKPLLKSLPDILGKDSEKSYLLLFQNNYERRATGGFLTSYAFFRIKDGKISVERSEDIYSLDNSISAHPTAPKEILTYHKNVGTYNIRDSNIYPDLPKSVEEFEKLYAKSSIDKDYDGIIYLDSEVLVDMLRIFGDTQVSGLTFSAQPDERCDCPQVIYSLFDMVDRPVNYIKTDRKGILGDLMHALLFKALGFSPSKYWGTLAQEMYDNLNEKHILMYFKDAKLQKAAENVGFAGRIKQTDGDYLHVNGVNFAGAKSNLFVEEEIEVEGKNVNGSIKKTVTITYKNPHPHSDCNLERGGLCLNATLRNWVRIYTPKGSKLDSFEGSKTKVNTYEESGKTVFEGFMTVEPKGLAKVKVEYTLPSTIKANDSYMIQKQPGVRKEKQSLSVKMDGKTLYDGPFDTDKLLTP